MLRSCYTILLLFLIGLVSATAQSSDHIVQSINQEYFGTKEKINISVDLVRQALTHKGRSAISLSIPVYGHPLHFEAIPNNVYTREDRNDNADILTCDLSVPNLPKVYGAVTFGADRLYVTLYNYGQMISIYPDFSTTDQYWVEYGIQPEMKQLNQFCTEHPMVGDFQEELRRNNGANRTKITMGSTLYEYDVALACTGEYYFSNGNSDNTVRTSMINSLNAISAIFKNEISYTLKTRSAIIKMYDNPGTDPFDPSRDRVEMAREVISMNFTSSRYDVGHVFHTHQDGDGWANGGVALLQAVCRDGGSPPFKAGGWSGSYSNQGNGWINLATHEFGHQFGASHTFNGTGGSCTDNISDDTAVEIGSGTTIMSYNGICDEDQNIPGSGILDNYFHVVSLEQMFNFVYNGSGGACGSPKPSVNLAPEVVANPCNAVYKIPINTPFYLEAVGTFPDDGDTHTFCWEQTDEDGKGTRVTQGKIGTRAASDSRAPLFRSYPPTNVPFRYFPALSTLTSGKVNPFDILPSVARSLNFNVSLRDNNTTGGAVANDDISIEVVSSGPFVITYPNGGEALTAGVPVVVKWNTNNSNALCSKVRIKLSFDGGNTYKFIIAENIDYSAGSQSITIPPSLVTSKDARMMIECMDYECFKIFTISKSNFEIVTDCIAPATTIAPDAHSTFLEGDPGLNFNLTNNIGKKVTTISGTLNTSDLNGNLIYLDKTPGVCAGPSNSNKYDLISFSVDKSGNYTFAHGGAFGTVLNLYEYEFTGTNCTNHIGSSATRSSGMGSIDVGNTMSVNLAAGKLYYMTVGGFSLTLPQLPTSYKVTLTSQPSGSNLFDGVYLPDGYIFTYIAVNSTSGLIKSESIDSDFRQLSYGEYCIYGVIYKEADSQPTSWINKSVSQVVLDGTCLQLSSNCKSLTINAGCRISEVTLGVQTACVLASNEFTQELILVYDRAPSSGKIVVNGQEFDVTASPQTIVLQGLDSDGLPVDVDAYFTEIPDCRFSESALFIAPKNCCPLEVDLGKDIEKCVGESATLDAGAGGASYIWKRNGDEILGTVNRMITVKTSGTYEVEVTHASGCKQTDKIEVTFHELPQVIILPDLYFCEGETFEIAPVITGANKIEWYRDGVKLAGEDKDKLQITEPGTYKIVVFNQYSCTNEASTKVEEIKAPVVELGPEQSKCEGESVILDAGNDGTTYVWYYNNTIIPDATNATYEPTKTGIYRVVVSNISQCSANDQVKVNFFASPSVAEFPKPQINACKGGTVDLATVITGQTSIRWYRDGVEIPFEFKEGITVNESGLYTVTASNLAMCMTSKSVEVEFRDPPVVDLGGPKLISCIGNPIVLNAGADGKTYEWTKNGSVLPETKATLTVTNDGIYKVLVTSEYGCKTEEVIDIQFIPGPSVTINGDASICDGESHTITITSDANNPEIKWFDENGQIPGESKPNLVVSKGGTYRVSVKGGDPACEVIKEVKITVNPRPTLDLGGDLNICDGSSPPVLDAGSNHTSYNWTLDGSVLATTQTVVAALGGTYNVEVKNAFGCSTSKSIKVSYLPQPSIENLNSTYSLCSNDILNIDITSNGTGFEWKKDNQTIQGVNTKSIEIKEGGLYEVIVTNVANCVSTKSFEVTERPSPIVDLGGDFTLCPGESRTISAGDHESYQWVNPNIGNVSTVLVENESIDDISITKKTYAVTVTNEYGCTGESSIVVTSIPKVIAKITADQPGVCNGEPVTLTASGGTSYKWTDPLGNSLSSLTDSKVIANPTSTAIYTVQVSDDGTCPDNSSTASIEIKIYEPVNVSAGRDTCVVAGRTIKLRATGGISYQWNHPELIVGKSNIADPEIKITNETVFTVTVTDANGCVYTAQVNVCIKEASNEFKLINIITPNGDGKNDELYFGDLSEYPDNTLTIFNRWGNVVFEANGYQHRGKLFDGLRRGERLPADTYYYILKLGDETFKSALTILWD